MAEHSLIEWTDATWPIVQGCDPVSPGCENCYAIKVVHRLAWSRNPKVSAPIKGCVESHKGKLRFTGKIALREDRLTWPLKWKQPKKIFVPSHGDIFHKDVPDEFLDRIFAVMALSPQHTFQVLTKRAERMREYFDIGVSQMGTPTRLIKIEDAMSGLEAGKINSQIAVKAWPLPNVWLGVSAERQQEADERIPLLLQTPAAVRFVSAEPLLGPIDLRNLRNEHHDNEWTDLTRLDWVIVGGESGSSSTARPMHPDWARSIRDQCNEAGVPFFFKQWGCWSTERPSTGMWKDFEPSVEKLGLGPNMWPVGKKAAGRLLDGVEHNEFPVTSQSRSEAA